MKKITLEARIKRELLEGIRDLESEAIDMQGGGDPNGYDANVAYVKGVAKSLRKLVVVSSKRTLLKVFR